MTDKEQIIINGVDVSGCEYACNTAFGKNGCKHPMMKNIYCPKNPNCYFKQLARKTQECEELKERIKCNCFDPKSNNNRCISYNRIAEDYERDLKHLKNKIAECEKLKEQLQANQPTGICETCMAVALLQNDSYRKALEKIEEIVSGNYETLDPLAKQQIQNIINKAKDGE